MSPESLLRWSYCLLFALPVAAGAQTVPTQAAPVAATATAGTATPTSAAKAKPIAPSISSKPTATAVSASRKALASQAKGLALATEVTETISAGQLEISNRVLTGAAQCEFNQTVDVDRVVDNPGYFRVRFKRGSYLMTPEETSTGAVRLVDRKQQVVWLQIPAKSMMMDQAAGRRMVDSCQHAEQRAAVEASTGAAQSGLLSR